MKKFTVPPGVKGFVIQDAQPSFEPSPKEFTTRRESAFTEAELVVDPAGEKGAWNPSSTTVGGDFARRGFMGFSKPGVVLLVPRMSVVVEEEEPDIVSALEGGS